MEFTGERFMPEFPSDWGSEHLHRYLLAGELCAGKNVLDVASGEGYGSALLADIAQHVVGVDISEEAVTFAREKYRKPNLVYRQGSATALPFENQTFDVVVSFETIEHLTEQESMMDELARVLRPDGLLIISSPDKLEYTDIPKHENEFHVKELYRKEFEALIRARFPHCVLYGQRLDYGSLIIGEEAAPFFSYEQDKEGTIRTSGLTHAMFHIALASQIELPKLPNSIRKHPLAESEMIRRKQADIDDWKKHAQGLERVVQERETSLTSREAELSEVGATLTATRNLLEDVEKRLLARESQVGKLGQELTTTRKLLEDVQKRLLARENRLAEVGEELTGTRLTLGEVNQKLLASQAELQSIYSSSSWKITAPLRQLIHLFRLSHIW